MNLGLETEKIYEPMELLIHNLRAGGRKPGMGCVMLKSEFTKKNILFEDDFKYVCEDQIFWAKVSLYARIYVAGACFMQYRQHNSLSVGSLIRSGK